MEEPLAAALSFFGYFRWRDGHFFGQVCRKPTRKSGQETPSRDGRTRTGGFLLPKQAPWPLGYIPGEAKYICVVATESMIIHSTADGSAAAYRERVPHYATC